MDMPPLSDFETHVGSAFRLALAADSEIDLVLVSAEKSATNNPAQSPDGRPFSLLFRGPEAQPFTQGIRTLTHPKMGEMALFLVPMQPNAEGPMYEAVFA